ncbi:Neuroendocrine convertase 2 [Cichlidogyrus casuarinus]|uniref:Neuroendocrine convertase 2 n=1 Tax=Cichlidogyrus casuarinus TaxID=1844966 RepID=A0ABD2PU68_9PLAT
MKDPRIAVLIISLMLVSSQASIHTNQFHVRLDPSLGSNRQDFEREMSQIARELGLTPIHQARFGSDNEFLLTHEALPVARSSPSLSHQRKIQSHSKVEHVNQLTGFMRRKRGYKLMDEATEPRGVNSLPPQQESILESLKSDPLFDKEWYIHNTGQADGVPGLDLNVLAAWAENVTGRGIVTAIMDDGLDYLHPDLAPNYSPEASYDFSSNDPYPYPRYTDDWFNSHGTRCAGEISAAAGNGICGVGVAPESKVAGLRMLDQPYMTDLIEAAAMSHARDIVDIYSASWGPTDDGKTVDGPRNQTMKALVDGVNKGRNGKGAIYVWASGDGGAADDCNCDGYAASMWTVSINSATNDGQTATYDESCASTLASTFSNGKSSFSQDAGVGTVDLYGNCTLHHSGTSAAAPEAAGVFALALEANPDLTWRDMQHLIVLTSKRNHLYDPTGKHKWTINGAGLEFNHLFGYGVLDAGDMVKVARKWVTVPERFHCIAGSFNGRRVIRVGEPLIIDLNTDSCLGNTKNQVNFIEHVQAFVSVKATRRGDLTIFLTSPVNTTSMMLGPRPRDADAMHGFTKWPFMTTHMWGENPRGKWTLTVGLDPNSSKSGHALGQAVLTEWILVAHGTQLSPYDKLPQVVDQLIPKLSTVKRQLSAQQSA